MKFGDSVGIKAPQWTANEQVVNTDINFLSESAYQNFIEAIVSIMMPSGLSAAFPDIILGDGMRLEWTAAMTANLHVGIAFSFTGSYYSAGTWGFTADAGSVFGAIVPIAAPVAVDVGDASDRYDTIEIRPVKNDYDNKTRWFQDPITGAQTQSSVPTRMNFGYEFQVLKGTPGLGVAPTHTAGWIKIAEVYVPASATALAQVNFLPCEETNTAWTAEKTVSQRRAVLLFAHDHIGGDGAAIAEGALSLADVTTCDVSTTKHGFVPKAPNDITQCLIGTGVWGKVITPHFSGLNVTSTTTSVTIAGALSCTDSTHVINMILASALTKTLIYPFATGTGNGGCFVTIAEQWMHAFLIRRDNDGAIDIGFDSSLTAANRPSGWTYYRRIFSFYVNSGLNIKTFIQSGNSFWFTAPTIDSSTALSTTAQLVGVSSPTGLRCLVHMNYHINTDFARYVYLSCPDCDDMAPSGSVAPLYSLQASTNTDAQLTCLTNIASQLRMRSHVSDGHQLSLATTGYVDLSLFN